MTEPRGAVAPLVRRVLELLPTGGDEIAGLVCDLIPEAMRSRLESGELIAAGVPPGGPGQSCLIAISGPGVRHARVGVILHGNGLAYTVALRAEGSRLPPELASADSGLDSAPPRFPESDPAASAWALAALATLTRPARELVDDHRWWGDVGALIMLADLVMEEGAGER